MARIPIATLTDNCWKKCPGFKVRDDVIFDDHGRESIFYRTLTCENLEVCAHAVSVCKEDTNASD